MLLGKKTTLNICIKCMNQMGIHLMTVAMFNMFWVLGYQWLDSDACQMFMLFPLDFGEGWESQFFLKKNWNSVMNFIQSSY